MKITDYIKTHRLFLDGGLGTLLQSRGLRPGEHTESWNLSHPEAVKEIHRSYFDAGSNVVCANSFGATSLKYDPATHEALISAAIRCVKEAASESRGTQEKWVALDLGPLGRMLAPFGDLQFEDAVSVFAESVKLGVKHGADLIFIETMNDSLETKAALLAAKENSDLPVFVSNAYGEDGKLMNGASPEAMIAMLEGMGADAIGMNCSFGPKGLSAVAEKYLKYSSLPVIFKPNAGLPYVKDGKTLFDVGPDEFAHDVALLAKSGVGILGGCCGTTPEYISAVVKATADIEFIPPLKKDFTCISSYSKAVFFDNKPILIGERINPTGKKRFKQALLENDIDYILKEGIAQQEKGVDVLDVNVGLPGIDEASTLKTAVCELQAIIDLPLQIDTSNVKAMEVALRCYNGKAMINSLSGKQEVMDAVFPLAKKYGGLIVALTLDENGIPENAEGRVAIAQKILAEAKKYGIDKKDIVFDTLTLTASADTSSPLETLRAARTIRETLGCHTVLGVSNVSFGLPCRDVLNGSFFTLALANGLSSAIMNPYSDEMMKAYYSFCALCGLDENCSEYICFAQSLPVSAVSGKSPAAESVSPTPSHSDLQRAIVKGLKEQASKTASALLKSSSALDIVQNEIIPALNIVGTGFEKKEVFLPQLLMSAEAAKSAFEQIKLTMQSGKEKVGPPFIIATVKGDIHDIGKNIVRLILENYGFNVVDLGRDVPAERIVEAALSHKASLVGLSALMTTTVPAMEETIKLLREKAPECKIVVGGAVLTREYAQSIGADKYAKDAMETVRFAQNVTNAAK